MGRGGGGGRVERRKQEMKNDTTTTTITNANDNSSKPSINGSTWGARQIKEKLNGAMEDIKASKGLIIKNGNNEAINNLNDIIRDTQT